MADDPKTKAAVAAERRRCAAILAMPEAQKAPQAAKDLAFGTSLSLFEARQKLQQIAVESHAAKASPREMATDSMRAKCGLPTKAPLRPGQVAALRSALKSNVKADRDYARKHLAAHGLLEN